MAMRIWQPDCVWWNLEWWVSPSPLSWLWAVVGVAIIAVCAVEALALYRQRDQAVVPSGDRTSTAWDRRALVIVAALPALYFMSQAQLADGLASIVRVELAGSWDSACQVYAPRGPSGLATALTFDLGLIAAYAVLFGGLALWAGALFPLKPVRSLRSVFFWAAVGAGICDLLENILLAAATANAGSSLWGWLWIVVAAMAWAKFVLLALVICYVAAGFWSGFATRHVRDLMLTETPPEHRDWHTVDVERQMVAQGSSGPDLPSYGITLSGGGIRASSISLGALQVLEDDADLPAGQRLGWQNADVVTAISGGSNLAAAWSISRTKRRHLEGETAGAGSPNPAGVAGRRGSWSKTAPVQVGGSDVEWVSPEERHLLDNLGYLASSSPRGDITDPAVGGSGQKGHSQPKSYVPAAYATVATGFIANAAVLLLIMWIVARPLGWLMGWLLERGLVCEPAGAYPRPDGPIACLCDLWDQVRGDGDPRLDALGCLSGDSRMVGPAVAWLIIGIVMVCAWVVVAKLRGRQAAASTRQTSQPRGAEPETERPTGRGSRRAIQALRGIAYGALGLGIVLSLLLILFPYLMVLAGQLQTGQASLVSLLGGAGAIGSVLRILRKPAARFAPMLGGIAFSVVVVFLLAYWAYGATGPGPTWELDSTNSYVWWLAAILALIVIHLGFSPEIWALAGFYRGKLRLAYANSRRQATMGSGDDPQRTRVVPYRNDDLALDESEREPALATFRTRRPGRQPDDVAEAGTPLTICATATTTTRAIRTHYGIPAMSVTFNPQQVKVFVPLDDRGGWGRYQASTRSVDALSRQTRKRVTTMLAIAIASAAVSPAMGKFRIGPTSMLLTFANLRLGVWMPNPRYVSVLEKALVERELGGVSLALGSDVDDQDDDKARIRGILDEYDGAVKKAEAVFQDEASALGVYGDIPPPDRVDAYAVLVAQRDSDLAALVSRRNAEALTVPSVAEPVRAGMDAVTYPRSRLGYLFKEFFGLHDFSDPYLYMTDGGHWENTGLVEMLRRGTIDEIVCVDADLSPGDAVRSVSQAIDLAAQECGVRVNLDLDPLRAVLANTRAPDYSERSVNFGFYEYPRTEDQAAPNIGVLWYARPALTKDMPAALLAHRETHPEYPRVSTMDQFFDTSTFVAYRNLGRYNARIIRESRQWLVTNLQSAPTFAAFQAAVETPPAGTQPDKRDWVCSELVKTVRLRAAEGDLDVEDYDGAIRAALGV